MDAAGVTLAGCATPVNREAYLVHSRFLAIGYALYAIRSFLRPRDERRFTNNGRGDGLYAHPADDADTDTAHELITPYCTTIELFRSLLDGSAGKLPHRPREPGQLFPE